MFSLGFPHSSVGKESTCDAGDPGSIPWLGRTTGEGVDYPFQYSRASLVAQLVKNMPAIQETWVQSLGWEDPLEKRKATHSNILAWRIPWTMQSMGLQRVRHDWVTFTSLHFILSLGFPGGASGKEPICQFRRHKRCGFNPGLGRYTGGGPGNPLQYSCLENSLDRGAWWATLNEVKKSQTHVHNVLFSTHSHMFSLLSLSLRGFDTSRESHCNRPSRYNRRPTGPSVL